MYGTLDLLNSRLTALDELRTAYGFQVDKNESNVPSHIQTAINQHIPEAPISPLSNYSSRLHRVTSRGGGHLYCTF